MATSPTLTSSKPSQATARRQETAAAGFAPAAGLALAVGAALLFAAPAPAQSMGRETVGEYQVKAAFLYHFAKFVEWPATQKGPTIAVCVIGNDPFGPMLDLLLDEKTLEGKRFEVRRVDQASDARACHILFLALKDAASLNESVKTLSRMPILTVGDSHEFGSAGGMIYLFIEQSKVRFDIDLDAAKRSGLRISSHLLRLARHVNGK